MVLMLPVVFRLPVVVRLPVVLMLPVVFRLPVVVRLPVSLMFPLEKFVARNVVLAPVMPVRLPPVAVKFELARLLNTGLAMMLPVTMRLPAVVMLPLTLNPVDMP